MRSVLLCLCIALPALVTRLSAEVPVPEVLDPGLKIELVAAEPEINTPVGIAVDRKGRVFVVENNTHQVRSDYKGPKSDRIRIFEDTNGDGKPDRVTTFAEGLRNAMCLKFDPDGVLHLTRRDAVIKMEDTDGDGVCDRQTTLLHWETKGDYPHNGLSGMAFSQDGWLYVGSGENLQVEYTAIGADGRKILYQPGGANVFRMLRDGSRLEIVATGLWNGFGLECDGAGRILAVDNDPDSCPPNRLLHIVRGGDYGFNMTYGRAGTHPFQCWNGEIPGTLPMVCGVGEAATDIMDLRHTGFRRRGLNVMVTSWGDNQIEAYQLVSRGASVTLGERRVVVRGDAEFRPACMAPAPDGSVYVTDWADREYSVHGKGRIWRISAKEPAVFPEAESVLALSRPESLIATGHSQSLSEMPSVLSDPFAWLAGVNHFVDGAVADPKAEATLFEELDRIIAKERSLPSKLGMMQVYHRMKRPYPEGALAALLKDSQPEVVRLAMIRATDARRKDLKPDIEAAIRRFPKDRDIFRTGIAALDLIEREAGAKPGAHDGLLLGIMNDAAQPAEMRALAMLSLGDRNAAARSLVELLKDKNAVVAAAAARTLGALPGDKLTAPLRSLALDAEAPVPARLEALAALSGKPDAELLPLLPLLNGEPELVRQTVRTVRGSIGLPEVKTALEKTFTRAQDPSVRAIAGIALGNPSADEKRPQTDEEWRRTAPSGQGSAEEGRRVFFSAAALCSTCHVAEGRGVTVGPDLSTIGRSLNRDKLLDSILTPGREIGPLYVMKSATLKDGRVIAGVQSLKETGGRVDLIQPGGKVETAEKHEVARIDIAPVSLMPEGLELALTVQEFRDLIAWLETLK